MFRRFLLLFLSILGAPLASAQSQWLLLNSTLSYRVSHPAREVDGVSNAGRGNGACGNGTCSFLIAAPVNTFRSGDSNRDLHMMETVRGGQFPMVVVRATFPESELALSTIDAELQVQFAGQIARYTHVGFQKAAASENTVRITGTIPTTCSDFKIVRPTFLAAPIRNEIPVRVDMTWKKQ